MTCTKVNFWASLVAQLVKNLFQCSRPWFDSWVGKIPRRRDRLPTPVFLGYPGGSAGKQSICDAGDLGSIPGLGRSPGEGKGYPLQYSGQESSMDCKVHGVAKSRTRLSDFHFLTLMRLSSSFVMDQNLRESSHLLVILQNLLGPLCGFFHLGPNYLFTYHFTKIYTIHT